METPTPGLWIGAFAAGHGVGIVGGMTIVPFPTKAAPPENEATALHVIPDVQKNHERDGQGPPIGSSAWACIDCGCFAFYASPTTWHCYECHREQRF